jgi:hypothetical protein
MNILADRGIAVELLQKSISTAESGLNGLPHLVKEILEKKAWLKREDPKSSSIIECESFIEFVTAPLRKGLGADVDILKKLCAGDNEALGLLDEAVKRGNGKRGKAKKADNNIISLSRPEGTSKQYALRSLRNHKKFDLLKAVEQGKLSANKAMIEAGLRPPPSPLKDLKRAWKKATQAEQTEFLAWISESHKLA